VETRRQENATALAVKTALVRQIGVSTAHFLSNAETLVLKGQRWKLADPFRAFEEPSFDIGSQLAAYFPDASAGREWQSFTSYGVRNAYYLLLLSPTGPSRDRWIARLSGYLGIGTDALAGLCFPEGDGRYEGGRRVLARQLQDREGAITADVVATPVTLATDSPTAPAKPAPPPVAANKKTCREVVLNGGA
jgi:hypothetical protein